MHLVAVPGQAWFSRLASASKCSARRSRMLASAILLPPSWRPPCLVRIAQDRVHLAAAQEDINRDDARRATTARCRGRRRSRAAAAAPAAAPARRCGMLSTCQSTLQAVAQAQLLQVEILPAQLDFVRPAARQLRGCRAISTRNRSAMSSSAASARRGSLRIERQHGVDAVEQEVRPDARLQRLQARLGDRRRERLGAKLKVDEQHAATISAERRRRAAARGGDILDRVAATAVLNASVDGERQRRTTIAPVRYGRRASHGAKRVQDQQLRAATAARRSTIISSQAPGERRPARFAQQRRDEHDRIDREQDAQDRAEIAQIRQREADPGFDL